MLSCSHALCIWGEPVNLSATKESFFRHNMNDASKYDIPSVTFKVDFVFKVGTLILQAGKCWKGLARLDKKKLKKIKNQKIK